MEKGMERDGSDKIACFYARFTMIAPCIGASVLAYKSHLSFHKRRLMPKLSRFGAGIVLAVLLAATAIAAQTPRIPLDSLQRRFVDQRFGMFLHFNMNTYVSGWGNARTNPLNFNPTGLDCAQWAAAAKSAKMKWAVLTCKHHEGFVIWPSKQTPLVSPAYTIAQSSTPDKDVVKSYTDAFRAAGIMPGLYVSGWDVAQNISRDITQWSAAQRTYILGQIRELLTNYGEIPIFWFDGYSWAMGHKAVPWQEIRDTIKALQPNCLIVETNGMYEPWETDILFFEAPLGISCPAGNTFASAQADIIANDWFWTANCTNIANLKSASSVVSNLNSLNSKYCSFLFDCPPNRQGKLDDAVVTRLGEIGAAWTPPARLRLPAQVPMIESPITPVSATATSGTAANAIDNHNDWSGGPIFQQLWQSTGSLPQSVTLDLGKVYDNITYLFYLPRREPDNTTGNITGYQIHYSADNSTWTQITTGTAIGGGGTFGAWPATSVVKKVQFAPVSARYVRLTASAVINELAVGGPAKDEVAVRKAETVPQALFAPGWSVRTSQRFVNLDPSLTGTMKTVSVYTLGGKLVGTKTTRMNVIDLRKECGVPEGTYIVKSALVNSK
jgi:alpha-L-fucosidase